MRFSDALTMIMSGAPAARTAWQSNGCECRVVYNAKRDRIRYTCETGGIRTDYNYYPTQADMLANDWELVRA